MTVPPGPDPSSPVQVVLRTLGAAELCVSGSGELLLGPGKPLALLIYLALSPGRRASREALLDLLWADLEPDRARSALRQTLFHLRRLVGEETLPGAEELTLPCPIDADRDRFLEAVEAGNIEGALACYTGPFLPAFGVPGGVGFEHWADLERDRLRAAFLRCGELQVRRYLNQSRFREAHRVARRVRDEAPHAESAWRLLLEAAVAGGDLVSAAVEADTLERNASEEGTTLEPATRKAIARARRAMPHADGVQEEFVLMAELTGREREFSMITAAWEGARRGGARHLHLMAPAGLGKTRLLRDAVARLRAGGATVVELRGALGDRDIPYAFAGDLAMEVAALPGARGIAPASSSALVALNPALSSRVAGLPDHATGEAAFLRRLHALADLIHAVAHETPFVLVVDDLHWVDQRSYQLLEAVLSRLGKARVLCLTASRPDRSPTGESVSVIPLAPLTPSQVGSLVNALGALPEGANWGQGFLAGLHAATQGSPLLILQTLQLAMDQDLLGLDGGIWTCADSGRLASLLRAGEALRQRIRGLPEVHGWVLALLATAGTTLTDPSVSVAAGLGPDQTGDVLSSLERLGLVRRTRGSVGWVVAHDEIGAAALDALDPSKQQAAAAAVGKLLLAEAAGDPARLLRAIHHLIAAGETAEVRRQFRSYVRSSRALRDRRSLSELAADVVQEGVGSSQAKALVATLPRSWRIGLGTPVRQGLAAAVLLVALGGVATVLRGREARHAVLQRLIYVDSVRATRVVGIRPVEWDGRTGPVIPIPGRSDLVDAALAFPDLPPAGSPDGRTVAWTRDAGDSTTLDIWLSTSTQVRRLTWQVRDDLVNSWLPDGSGLLGMSNRWSSPQFGGYDIAVFDTGDGSARAIAPGPGHDRLPFLSPDGTRVVFLKEGEDGLFRVCLIPFDGLGTPVCRLPGGHPLAQLLGWSGLFEVVVVLDSAGARSLERYHWQRDQRSPMLSPHVYRGLLSPDRRWVVAAVRGEGLSGSHDWVVPVDRPTLARRVSLEGRGGGTAPSVRWWEGRYDQSELIERIEFHAVPDTLVLGSVTRLRVRALAAGGREIPLLAPVRWTSGDTLVAAIDSGGVVHPRQAGTATITASLAGWRTVSRRFVISGVVPEVVLREQWEPDWAARWISFGLPAPAVAKGPGGTSGLWNHGDGTYPSFAVLRRALVATGGLGVEVRLSTPSTRVNWQRSRTYLIPGVDTTALVRGDQGRAPASIGRIEDSCGAGYPAADGESGLTRLAVAGGVALLISLGPVSDLLRSGEWWTLRLQILPDGRCGIAINGIPVWLSPEAIPLGEKFWLRLGDESFETTILHGPLELWTGVRTDVDWSRVAVPPPQDPARREPR